MTSDKRSERRLETKPRRVHAVTPPAPFTICQSRAHVHLQQQQSVLRSRRVDHGIPMASPWHFFIARLLPQMSTIQSGVSMVNSSCLLIETRRGLYGAPLLSCAGAALVLLRAPFSLQPHSIRSVPHTHAMLSSIWYMQENSSPRQSASLLFAI